MSISRAGSVVGPPGGDFSPMGMPRPPSSFGALRITVAGCKNLGPNIANQTDKSFVRVRIGDQERKTGTAKEGGSRPRFGDELVCDVRMEREVELSLCVPGQPDVVLGTVRSNIMPWIAQGSFSGDLDLKDSSFQPIGQITINARFERNSVGAPLGGPGSMVGPGNSLAGMTGIDGGSIRGDDINAPPALFSDEEIKEAFVQFDLDKNGFVGAAEIRHILINIGETVTDEEVDEMVKMVDRSGDGQVSFPDFYRMVSGGKEAPPGLYTMPGKGSANPNDSISDNNRSVLGGMSKRSGVLSPTTPKAGGDAPVNEAAAAKARGDRKDAMGDFAKDFGITEAAIKRAFAEFEAADKGEKGTVDYAAFCDLLTVEPGPAVERLFQMFDSDKSGQVDFREFVVGLHNFTHSSRDEKTKFAFSVFDQNNDGFITKDELIRILRSNHMAASDKEVSRKADTILAQADSNNDNAISLAEFQKVATRFPNILYATYALGDKAKAKLDVVR